MKYISIFFLFVYIIATSCKKDATTDNNYYQYGTGTPYLLKGILLDSLSGNPIAGQTIYFTFDADTTHNMGYFSKTNSKGEFTGNIPGSFFGTDPRYPPPPNLLMYLTSCSDSLAGYCTFTYADLKLNDTLQTNIYLVPIGYLSLRIVDSTMTISTNISCIPTISTNKWFYNTQNNGFADTTLLIKSFGNRIVQISVSYDNSGDNILDSAYIPSRDTIIKAVKF